MMNRDYIKIGKLVDKVKEGDLQAFDELYSLTYNKVYLLSLSILKNKDMAEDATQEIFINSLKSINQLKNPKLFLSWINKITYNYCLQEVSKLKHVELNSFENIFSKINPKLKYSDPLEYCILKEDMEEFIELIGQLTQKQSTILVLKYIEGLKISEIAYVLDIPEGTVKSRLSKAKKKFRKLYINTIKKRENRKDFNMDYVFKECI